MTKYMENIEKLIHDNGPIPDTTVEVICWNDDSAVNFYEFIKKALNVYEWRVEVFSNRVFMKLSDFQWKLFTVMIQTYPEWFYKKAAPKYLFYGIPINKRFEFTGLVSNMED